MKIDGDEAKFFNAVRLDSFQNVNQGTLISADEQTGEVHWSEKITNEDLTLTLGPNAIKIISVKR
jgi:hypothetical protein